MTRRLDMAESVTNAAMDKCACGRWKAVSSGSCKSCSQRARWQKGVYDGTVQPQIYNRDEIEKLALSGLSQTEVAKRIGCSVGHVGHVMRERGYRTKWVKDARNIKCAGAG